jgi:hypothetical protein
MTERNTANVLKGDLTAEDNFNWLLNRFRDEVERYLTGTLTPEMRARINVRALADTILRQSVREASQQERYRESSDAFRALLFLIAKRKRCSAVTFTQADSRDPGTPIAGSEAIPHVSDQRIPPGEQAASRELMTAVLGEMVQDRDEDRVLINILGCALKLNAQEIQDVLIARSPHKKPPSLPTIRSQIKKTRAKILEMFNLEDDD